MKKNQSSILSDSAFLLLFIACFISIVFTAEDPNQYIQNIIFLNLAFLIAIITYFTTVTTGLILNILFLFGYGTFVMYQSVVIGGSVEFQSYFWLIMTPVYTVIAWMITSANRKLQTENEHFKKINSRLATMDENTNLKNSLAFQNDATVFMALSVRYNIPLVLMVINIKYWNDLKGMISEEFMTETIRNVSQIGQTSIRTNDSLYLLNKDNPTWGMLLFTDQEGAKNVIDRLRKRASELNTTVQTDKKRIELSFKIGATLYNPETITTPLDFIVVARKQLEYDV
ncbi:diguanylate cyclase [Paenibacillus sp. HB172176]|uniref:GGDEF domain-containing protein n=1 Tax=Paenibacillus sp. HB172176 TaxID=2493690 RepID=UPI00143B1BB5|nr:diguanylate cyclase [Paenibacillus sp. HB172176]